MTTKLSANVGQRGTVLLTAQQVADRFAVDLKTVRRKTRRGEFNDFALNLGSQQRPEWRYDEALLERWLDSRRAA